LDQLKKADSDSTAASISPSEKMLNDCLAYVSLFGTYNNKQAIAEAKVPPFCLRSVGTPR